MRALSQAAVYAGMFAALIAPAQAQQGRGGGMFMGGAAGLLANPSVHKELDLNEEQASKARALADEQRGKMMEAMQGLRDSGLDREGMMAKMQEIQRTQTAETKKELGSFLKPEQAKRFNQIELQQRGLNAFTDPEVVKALKITEEQQAHLREHMEEMREKTMAAFQDAGDDRQAAMAKIAEIRRESMKEVVGHMSEDQKKAWKELTGEPFEVQPGGPGRGRN